MNRNKRSIALDLRTEEGKKVFLRLVEEADVVAENFRPGVMGRLGLGYKDLKGLNPALVYCSVSGFGQTGTVQPPGRLRPGGPGHERNHERHRNPWRALR